MIWVMLWKTESGDEGVGGYWTTEPTNAEKVDFVKKHAPDDFEAETFYYNMKSLKKIR